MGLPSATKRTLSFSLALSLAHLMAFQPPLALAARVGCGDGFNEIVAKKRLAKAKELLGLPQLSSAQEEAIREARALPFQRAMSLTSEDLAREAARQREILEKVLTPEQTSTLMESEVFASNKNVTQSGAALTAGDELVEIQEALTSCRGPSRLSQCVVLKLKDTGTLPLTKDGAENAISELAEFSKSQRKRLKEVSGVPIHQVDSQELDVLSYGPPNRIKWQGFSHGLKKGFNATEKVTGDLAYVSDRSGVGAILSDRLTGFESDLYADKLGATVEGQEEVLKFLDDWKANQAQIKRAISNAATTSRYPELAYIPGREFLLPGFLMANCSAMVFHKSLPDFPKIDTASNALQTLGGFCMIFSAG